MSRINERYRCNIWVKCHGGKIRTYIMEINSRKRAIAAVAILQHEKALWNCTFEHFQEDDDDIILIGQNMLHRRDKIPRIENYAEHIVPSQSLDDFKSHFRLSRDTFQTFVESIGECSEIHSNSHGRTHVAISKQAMVFLWYIGTPDSFRSISDRFGISKSTAHNICRRVCSCIINNLMKDQIYWPSNSRRDIVSKGFEDYCKFPGVIGAIDGSHMSIKAPNKVDNPVSYINRKKYHSVVLQGVCDHELLFTHVYTGWPGSTHDARVFRNSAVFQESDQKFRQEDMLLGDSAYPLLSWLMTPHKDYGALTPLQKVFNKRLSSARVAIERAFGQLKGRFRRLQHLDISDFELLCHTILSSCVMHNMCIRNDDESIDEILEEPVNTCLPHIHNDGHSGLQRRTDIEGLFITN